MPQMLQGNIFSSPDSVASGGLAPEAKGRRPFLDEEDLSELLVTTSITACETLVVLLIQDTGELGIASCSQVAESGSNLMVGVTENLPGIKMCARLL